MSRTLPSTDGSFQERVGKWMEACFTPAIITDKLELADRFIEESLELVQATGYSAERAHALVDYVFNRPVGEPFQEVGGVMVTLAALCNPHDLDMDKAAETELARIWTKIDKIRAKQATKPVGSALPIPTPSRSTDALCPLGEMHGSASTFARAGDGVRCCDFCGRPCERSVEVPDPEPCRGCGKYYGQHVEGCPAQGRSTGAEMVERVIREIEEYGEGLVPELRIVCTWLAGHFRDPEVQAAIAALSCVGVVEENARLRSALAVLVAQHDSFMTTNDGFRGNQADAYYTLAKCFDLWDSARKLLSKPAIREEG